MLARGLFGFWVQNPVQPGDMGTHLWCSLHKNQQQIFNMRIQGDTKFPFTQKEHMVDTGTGSPQASSTYSMEAYFSASTSIKVAGIKGWHSTSVLTRFGHQKCKLSLLLQWRKCNREATRRPVMMWKAWSCKHTCLSLPSVTWSRAIWV